MAFQRHKHRADDSIPPKSLQQGRPGDRRYRQQPQGERAVNADTRIASLRKSPTISHSQLTPRCIADGRLERKRPLAPCPRPAARPPGPPTTCHTRLQRLAGSCIIAHRRPATHTFAGAHPHGLLRPFGRSQVQRLEGGAPFMMYRTEVPTLRTVLAPHPALPTATASQHL